MKFKKDFTYVYTSVDVEEAASRLTEKLVEVLNKHAPWIIFQQRKNFSPWITGETLKLMKQWDKLRRRSRPWPAGMVDTSLRSRQSCGRSTRR